MSEYELERLLAELLANIADTTADDPCMKIVPTELLDPAVGLEGARTLEGAEQLTGDAGLVVRMFDGCAFQITIVPSGAMRAGDQRPKSS